MCVCFVVLWSETLRVEVGMLNVVVEGNGAICKAEYSTVLDTWKKGFTQMFVVLCFV